ncbi:outer membrane protein transport protein [Gaetbulibacter aquiaggeris]|uniref:Outer membrane protein transport protein n=1 Tax=Gaetbulibacter aquiaggeris TaxID=1735373 RepID=A0ABW7MVQ9_9FLAO
MKKLNLLFIGILSMSFTYGQDITDALRYSQDDIQGTARFRALSGAFGALGGDMSAVSLNPAGSAVFTRSHASFSLSNLDTKNDSQYFNGFTSASDSKFDFNQGGAVFVFSNNDSNSAWKKFALSIGYDKMANYDNIWVAKGTNTNNNSIDLYFLGYADGLRLDEISALPGESISEAYSEIGSYYGFGHQQAFLGYESYILEPDTNDDANTTYFSNIANGTFDQEYIYATRGYNGKITFNAAVQYEDNLFLGLNLNSHLLHYDRSTQLFEDNSNLGSIINNIDFENTLSTIGTGFSFQLGGILKVTNEFRLGLTYDSPTWYTMEEETTQYLFTNSDIDGPARVNPQIVNIYPSYRLQTPGKITGSLAYVFGDQGLLSFDYALKDYGSAKFKPTSDSFFADQNRVIGNDLVAASTYRFGGEYRVKQFSFRGGYRFEESPYKNGLTVGDLTGYSLGIGFNFGNTKLDLTYDQAKRNSQTQLYNVGLTDAALIDAKNSNITFSIGFNI